MRFAKKLWYLASLLNCLWLLNKIKKKLINKQVLKPASDTEPRHLTQRLDLSQKGWDPLGKARPLKDRLALSQINQSSHREAGSLKKSLSLSHRGLSHRRRARPDIKIEHNNYTGCNICYLNLVNQLFVPMKIQGVWVFTEDYVGNETVFP